MSAKLAQSAKQTITGGLCGGCKHWRKAVDEDYGNCMRFQAPQLTLTGRIAGEDSAYSSGRLITRAEFGCNQFERQSEPRL